MTDEKIWRVWDEVVGVDVGIDPAPFARAILAAAPTRTQGADDAQPVATIREQFEAWFSQKGRFPKDVERSGEGYKEENATRSWYAWQAARATPADHISQARDAETCREVGVWEPNGRKFKTYRQENLDGVAMFVKVTTPSDER